MNLSVERAKDDDWEYFGWNVCHHDDDGKKVVISWQILEGQANLVVKNLLSGKWKALETETGWFIV